MCRILVWTENSIISFSSFWKKLKQWQHEVCMIFVFQSRVPIHGLANIVPPSEPDSHPAKPNNLTTCEHTGTSIFSVFVFSVSTSSLFLQLESCLSDITKIWQILMWFKKKNMQNVKITFKTQVHCTLGRKQNKMSQSWDYGTYHRWPAKAQASLRIRTV